MTPDPYFANNYPRRPVPSPLIDPTHRRLDPLRNTEPASI
jgi:hypothetical protein